MHCPNCGQENNDLATRCSACGSELPGVSETSPTLELEDQKPADTEERPMPLVEEPQDAGEGQPAYVGTAKPRKGLVSRGGHRASAFIGKHQKALGVGLALTVVAVIAIVWVVVIFMRAPTYTHIEQDLSERIPTYSYAGGTFGSDLQIPLSSISVTKRERTQTPDGFEANGKGAQAYRVEAEAIYDDGNMRVVRDVGATYVQQGDNWTIVGELDESGTSFTAHAGVDEGKVLANMPAVLQAASGGNEVSLADIYADGAFSIASNNFEPSPEQDTSTDDVVIACSKDNGFYAYAGNVTARFAFESGEWRLRTAEADTGATMRTYEPLVGTWTGSMVSHESNGGSCYGAQHQPLTVVINSVGDPAQGRGQVQGIVTGLAHFHERLSANASSNPGDKLLEDMPFSGAITADYDRKTGSSLNIECSTSGSEEDSVTILLSFGTDNDPSAVFARVTSTHQYEEVLLFWLPHQTSATFTDTYLLVRAE